MSTSPTECNSLNTNEITMDDPYDVLNNEISTTVNVIENDVIDNNMDSETIKLTSPDNLSSLQPDTLPIPVMSKSNEITSKTLAHPFPISRVKSLMKADPDTHLIQSEATIIVNEAAKLFLTDFVREVQHVTLKHKRKIITKTDIDSCIALNDKYMFMEEQLNW